MIYYIIIGIMYNITATIRSGHACVFGNLYSPHTAGLNPAPYGCNYKTRLQSSSRNSSHNIIIIGSRQQLELGSQSSHDRDVRLNEITNCSDNTRFMPPATLAAARH